MSNRKQRFAALSAACLLLGTVLVACNSRTVREAQAAGGADTAAVAEPAEPAEFQMMHNYAYSSMRDIVEGSISRYMERNPWYGIEVIEVPTDLYREKLIVMWASDQLPDIFVTGGGMEMVQMVQHGALQDVSEQMDREGFRYRFFDAALDQVIYQDGIYGVPAEMIDLALVVYQKAIFEECGIDIPTSLQELEDTCGKLQYNGYTPFTVWDSIPWASTLWYTCLANRYGLSIPSDQLSDAAWLLDEAILTQAGSTAQEWIIYGFFREAFENSLLLEEKINDGWYRGNDAMTLTTCATLAKIRGEDRDFYESLGVFVLPPAASSAADSREVVGAMSANLYHISTNCRDVDGAFGVLQSLLDDIAVQERLDGGMLPPLWDIEVEEPLLRDIWEIADTAPRAQLWLSRCLPDEVYATYTAAAKDIFAAENILTEYGSPRKHAESIRQSAEEYAYLYG